VVTSSGSEVASGSISAPIQADPIPVFSATKEAFLVNLLLVTFWTTLVVNYFRGIDVGCGCFSTTPDQVANMLWYIVRDGFFVLLGLAAVLVARKLAAFSGK